jgi:Fic family protein
MRSFEYDYYLDTPLSHQLVMSMRTLGEFRGRQVLYAGQFPEVLETLRRTAVVQSIESSNRIEGITVAADRIVPLAEKQTKPQDRPEQEVAGYRDVLAAIHAGHSKLGLSAKLIREWHGKMHRYTSDAGGRWKDKDNAILEVRPDGKQVVRFRPVSAIGTPEFMKSLVTLFRKAMSAGEADPLLLIASFILDFECVHPFADGNGRIGRLLTLLLLYQSGYEVGRYVSLERIVEESKETYYEALYRSSQGWHKGQHDLRPWWEYFLGMLTAAYREFESRVGSITSARGAKREMVISAVEHLPKIFRFADLQQACPGVSYPTLRRALDSLRKSRKLRCIGRGRDAQWERI